MFRCLLDELVKQIKLTHSEVSIQLYISLVVLEKELSGYVEQETITVNSNFTGTCWHVIIVLRQTEKTQFIL